MSSLATSPCKVYLASSPCRFAASQGVHWYTFDSEYEIQKVAALDPSAKFLVRLKVDNTQSLIFQVLQYAVLFLQSCMQSEEMMKATLLFILYCTL